MRWGLLGPGTVDRAYMEPPVGSHVSQALALTKCDSPSQGHQEHLPPWWGGAEGTVWGLELF